MLALLVIFLLLGTGFADAQTQVPSTPATTNPALPPGLPSPSQQPIAVYQSPNAGPVSTPPSQPKQQQTPRVAPPAFEPPVEELAPNDVGLENADQAVLNDNNIDTITGNIRLRYRTYTLYADKAVVDTDSGVAVLSGHVRLVSDDKSVVVNSMSPNTTLTLDLRKGTYGIVDGSAIIAPSAVPQVTGLLLPIRLYGGDINGSPRLIDARDTSATTCDFASPHYFFKAKSTTIIPGKRLVARSVTFYRRHKKIITIPYVLFPLDNRYLRQGLTPLIGYDPEEGYFAKFATPYVLAAAAVGILRLDLMSRAGIGTGITQSFTTGGAHQQTSSSGTTSTPGASGTTTSTVGSTGVNSLTTLGATNNPTSTGALGQYIGTGIFGNNALQGGTIQIYHLDSSSEGLNTTTGSLTDSQLLFHNVRLSIDTQFQNDDYLSSASKSTAISGQFVISRNVKGATTSLTTNVQESDYGLGNSETITSSLLQQNAVSKITNTSVKIDFSQYTTPSFDGIVGTYQDTIETNIDVTSHPIGYQIELQANTFTANSSVPGELITGGVERLPELTIESVPTTTDRLLPGLLPALARYTLDLGDFQETSDNTEDLRAEMGLDLGNNHEKYRALTTIYTGSFLQSFYSDDTARYVLQDQVQELYNFQKQSSVGINYSYLQPYGYTPFLFDETGSYNTLNFNVNYQPTKRLTATASSGFNIGQDHTIDGIPATPWLDINGQIQYVVAKRLSNILTGSYDPNRGLLFNVADTTRLTLSWGLALDSSLNYVPQTGQFSNISGDIDLPIVTDSAQQAGYTLRALASYDEETSTFNYQAFELTRSWHDWELSGIYQDNTTSIPGNSFFINFRLKAFPGFEPFGTGSLGQGLATGTGQVL